MECASGAFRGRKNVKKPVLPAGQTHPFVSFSSLLSHPLVCFLHLHAPGQNTVGPGLHPPQQTWHSSCATLRRVEFRQSWKHRVNTNGLWTEMYILNIQKLLKSIMFPLNVAVFSLLTDYNKINIFCVLTERPRVKINVVLTETVKWWRGQQWATETNRLFCIPLVEVEQSCFTQHCGKERLPKWKLGSWITTGVGFCQDDAIKRKLFLLLATSIGYSKSFIN